jgi:D-citramalate synthase
LTPPKKLEIARALDALGVKVIEAGFAAVSQGEREAVELISRDGLEAEICSATRSVIKDIDVAIDAGVDSVNIIIPVSELHISKKFEKKQDTRERAPHQQEIRKKAGMDTGRNH